MRVWKGVFVFNLEKESPRFKVSRLGTAGLCGLIIIAVETILMAIIDYRGSR